MLKLTLLFTLAILIITFQLQSQTPRFINSKDVAVLISAKSFSSPEPKIVLNWQKGSLVSKYEVRRKLLNQRLFPDQPYTVLDSNVTMFEDKLVDANQVYEYEVRAYSRGSLSVKFKRPDNTTFDSAVAHNFVGFGYITSGIKISEYDNPGKIMILVDETIAEPLDKEIKRLVDDMLTEGWTVRIQNVPRTEKFNGEAVKSIKNIITEENNKSDAPLKAVLLLGRIAVPYSGALNPDAHGDHYGAWPSDLYYGQFDEYLWNDFSINTSVASRQENKNVPGDGKFDASEIGSDVTAAVGRVDFYNMPFFINDSVGLSEIDLYKRYLDKNHNFRTGKLDYKWRGLIDDNFGASSIYEAFAASGWRNLAAFFAYDSVKSADYLTSLKTDSYLWSYGCGGGSYIHASGIAVTGDFVNNPINTVFTMLFGSYFGDYDSQNNFLRSALCTNPSALTCVWSGRPHWFMHHMALGYPIGFSTIMTQNNSTSYLPNYYWLPIHYPNFPNGLIYSFGIRGVHANLMGDPSLRMYADLGKSFKSLQLTVEEGNKVLIDWDYEEVIDFHHFNVYRSDNPLGPFIKINEEPIKYSFFRDTSDIEGEAYYMVRPCVLTNSNTGSFYSPWKGEIAMVVTTSVEELSNEIEVLVSPNPASDKLVIEYKGLSNIFSIEIADLNGTVVYKSDYRGSSSSGSLLWDARLSTGQRVASGIYIVRINTGTESIVRKLIIR